MFVEYFKKLRLMKSSEATGFGMEIGLKVVKLALK